MIALKWPFMADICQLEIWHERAMATTNQTSTGNPPCLGWGALESTCHWPRKRAGGHAAMRMRILRKGRTRISSWSLALRHLVQLVLFLALILLLP